MVNGTSTIEDNQKAAKFIAKQIKKCYSNVNLTDWRTQNIVASINFGRCIDLPGLKTVCEKLDMPKGKEGYQY